jgi:hypothetical protein
MVDADIVNIECKIEGDEVQNKIDFQEMSADFCRKISSINFSIFTL